MTAILHYLISTRPQEQTSLPFKEEVYDGINVTPHRMLLGVR